MEPRYPMPRNVCFRTKVRSAPGRTLVTMSSGVADPRPASTGLSSWLAPIETVGVNTPPALVAGLRARVRPRKAHEQDSPRDDGDCLPRVPHGRVLKER